MTKDLVKLNNVDHASQRVVTEFGAQWGDNQMTCLAHTAEMRTFTGTYPILFQSTADAEYPLPVALMGFETGENPVSLRRRLARTRDPHDDAQRALLYRLLRAVKRVPSSPLSPWISLTQR